MDFILIQAVFHVIIGLLFLGLTVLVVPGLRVAVFTRILAAIVGTLLALYRFDTAWYVWTAQNRVEAGYSGTVPALILNANILAFCLGLALMLVLRPHGNGR